MTFTVDMSKIKLEWFRNQLEVLSGSGKRLSTQRRHGLYSTMTLPGLDDMPAVRDTKRRFEDFGIPEDLTDKTVIDVGSNVGAMIFEAARRGATITGIEYHHERVSLCRMMAQRWGYSDEFYEVDLNAGDLNFAIESFLRSRGASGAIEGAPWLEPHDIVICCSVDEYVDDLESFHELLRALCKDTMYFESNVQRDRTVDETVEILHRSGFQTVEYIGNGHSGGISRKRKLFRARVVAP